MLNAHPSLNAASYIAAQITASPWIDLIDPTDEETAVVAANTGLRVPSRDALMEIESTSRNYMENGAVYLSAPLVVIEEDGETSLTPVGFVLEPHRLLTVRFTQMKAFDAANAAAAEKGLSGGEEALVLLLEAIVDKGADLLERAGADLDALSRAAFRVERAKGRGLNEATSALREALRRVGRTGDRISHIRDVLLGLGRITGYLLETSCSDMTPELHQRLSAVRADIVSLNDYQTHLEGKVQFLLDATLGFISIEQNDIVKVLTIASIVGVPPVFFAGVWGMNFKSIPEYDWAFGYPFAWGVIILSAILPLAWFKWRGWM